VAMKHILHGEGDAAPSPELVMQLALEIYNTDLLESLVLGLDKLEFEARKDVAAIFNTLVRRKVGTRLPTVEYLEKHASILLVLQQGYEKPDVSLNCGMMLREAIAHESLARIALYDDAFYRYFEYVELNTFEIASDAFATFKALLTVHKPMVSEFLQANYDQFFDRYTTLLNAGNYVTKRQMLKLLGEILLDRANFTVMTRYISQPDNLKLMMNLLRDKSRSIQFEAFHVFKVFVANPNKAKPVSDILRKNRDKLIVFLNGFQTDRTDDDQFNDEKAFLVKQIQDMPPLAA